MIKLTLSSLLFLFTLTSLAQNPEIDVFVQGQLGIGGYVSEFRSSEIGPSYGTNVGVDFKASNRFSFRFSGGYHSYGETSQVTYRETNGLTYEGESILSRFSNNLNLGARYWFESLPIAIGIGGSFYSEYQYKLRMDVRTSNDPNIDGVEEFYIPITDRNSLFGAYTEALYRFKLTDQIGLNTGLFCTYSFYDDEQWSDRQLWSVNANVELVYTF